jgi:hypothetical protein
MIVPSSGGLVPRIVDGTLTLGRRLRRGVIRSVAIVTMLGIYVVTSIGTIGTSALGVVGISSLALVGTTAPAQARRRWRRYRHRRRHRGYYRRRWHRGYYWGYPWRRRRRWRGPAIYFRF